jgi:hypothetical protein
VIFVELKEGAPEQATVLASPEVDLGPQPD